MSQSETSRRIHVAIIVVCLLGSVSVMLAWVDIVSSDGPKTPMDRVNMWAWPAIASLSLFNVWYIVKVADEHYLKSALMRATVAAAIGYVVVRLIVLGVTATAPISLFELESWYWQIILMSLVIWFVYPHRVGIWFIGLLYFVAVAAHVASVIGNPAHQVSALNMVPFISSYIVLGAILAFSVALGYTNDRIIRLDARATAMEQLAHVDGLTGVANRRGLDKALTAMLARPAGPLTVIMMDVDDFKSVNDIHGHLVGDQVLVELARLVKQSIRENDVFGRWGGEEFLIVLPGLDLTAGVTTAERLRHMLTEHQFSSVGTITASFSVVAHNPGETAVQLVQRADAKLYAAKDAGRDRVFFDKADFAL